MDKQGAARLIRKRGFEMKKSNAYIFGFVVFCLMALVKLVALGFAVYGIAAYLASAEATEAVSSKVIAALIADFLARIIMWAINKGIRIYKRPTPLISLLAPVLLLAVLILSVVMVGYDPESGGAAALNAVCWILMGVYLLLPDLFITRDMVALRHGFPAVEEQTGKPTLSERIRKAKK